MKYIFSNKKKSIKFKFYYFIFLIIWFSQFKIILKRRNKLFQKNLKIALCTMGKKENLYSKEFIDYYIKLGINQIFIYDHNEPNTENIIDTVENIYKNKVTVYKAFLKNITNQAEAFTDCYKNNYHYYDWFLMVDMDEYLYIKKETLSNYLKHSIFDKCDIINFHWVIPNDNNLIYYDKRPLFERFKGPYTKSVVVKSMIRGNISNVKYSVHSPNFSPERNITCNNEGKKIDYKNLNIEFITKISIKKAYIIHFRYKSTQEFINKYKRGYSNWFGNRINSFLYSVIEEYFQINKITLEKINFIEKELNLNLSIYKEIYYRKQKRI